MTKTLRHAWKATKNLRLMQKGHCSARLRDKQEEMSGVRQGTAPRLLEILHNAP